MRSVEFKHASARIECVSNPNSRGERIEQLTQARGDSAPTRSTRVAKGDRFGLADRIFLHGPAIHGASPDAHAVGTMDDEFEIGQVIGDTPYRVVQRIGKGGMGSVYEVEHRELGKRFVLKALLRQFVSRNDLVQRLRNEWRALGQLEHPNIVSVTDAGVTSDRLPYYVMERLTGETLANRIRNVGRLSMIEALDVTAGVLDGLSAAHAIGVVHRDIKPPNIFLTSACVPKVLDFGIAKLLDGTAPITSRGMAIGTPRYISPEQASGDAVDARADLYAVGLVLFEMLVGESPFEDVNTEDLLVAHLTKAPPRLSKLVESIPPELDHLVARLLAKKPEDRLPSARGASAAIRAIARGLTRPSLTDTVRKPFDDALTPIAALPALEQPDTLREGVSVSSGSPFVRGDGPTQAVKELRRGHESTGREKGERRGGNAESGETAQTEALPPHELDVDASPTHTAVSSPVPQLGAPTSMPPWDVSARVSREWSRHKPGLFAAVAGVAVSTLVVLGIWALSPDPVEPHAAGLGQAAPLVGGVAGASGESNTAPPLPGEDPLAAAAARDTSALGGRAAGASPARPSPPSAAGQTAESAPGVSAASGDAKSDPKDHSGGAAAEASDRSAPAGALQRASEGSKEKLGQRTTGLGAVAGAAPAQGSADDAPITNPWTRPQGDGDLDQRRSPAKPTEKPPEKPSARTPSGSDSTAGRAAEPAPVSGRRLPGSGIPGL